MTGKDCALGSFACPVGDERADVTVEVEEDDGVGVTTVAPRRLDSVLPLRSGHGSLTSVSGVKS